MLDLSYPSIVDSRTVKTIRLAVLSCTLQIVCDLLSNQKESQQPENNVNTASPLPPLTDGRDIPSPLPPPPLSPQTAGVKLPSLSPPFLSKVYSCHCGVLGTLDQSHVDLMQVFSAPELQTTALLGELQGVQLRKVSLYTIISLYVSCACMFCVSLSICDQLPRTGCSHECELLPSCTGF